MPELHPQQSIAESTELVIANYSSVLYQDAMLDGDPRTLDLGHPTVEKLAGELVRSGILIDPYKLNLARNNYSRETDRYEIRLGAYRVEKGNEFGLLALGVQGDYLRQQGMRQPYIDDIFKFTDRWGERAEFFDIVVVDATYDGVVPAANIRVYEVLENSWSPTLSAYQKQYPSNPEERVTHVPPQFVACRNDVNDKLGIWDASPAYSARGYFSGRANVLAYQALLKQAQRADVGLLISTFNADELGMAKELGLDVDVIGRTDYDFQDRDHYFCAINVDTSSPIPPQLRRALTDKHWTAPAENRTYSEASEIAIQKRRDELGWLRFVPKDYEPYGPDHIAGITRLPSVQEHSLASVGAVSLHEVVEHEWVAIQPDVEDASITSDRATNREEEAIDEVFQDQVVSTTAELDKHPSVYRPRPARQEDIARLVEIDMLSFDSVYRDSGQSKEELQASVTRMFQNRFEMLGGDWIPILEDEQGKIGGFLVCCPTNKTPEDFVSWEDTTDNGTLVTTYDPNGRNIYVVTLSMTPEAAKQSGQDILYMNQFGKMMELGIGQAFFESRIPGLRSWVKKQCRENGTDPAELTDDEKFSYAQQYVTLRSTVHGKEVLQDRLLRIFEGFGAKFVKVAPNAYKDKPSMNFGVVCVIDNPVPKKLQGNFVGKVAGKALRFATRHPKIMKKIP